MHNNKIFFELVLRKELTDIKMKTSFLEKFSDYTELPKDLITGMPKLTLIGSVNLQVDNYRGLLEYTSEKIRLSAKSIHIEITGTDLNFTKIEEDTVFIEGCIEKIELVQKNKSFLKKQKE